MVEQKVDVAAEKEKKRLARAQYKVTHKELVVHCEANMQGTRYDRFYVDELVKKYPKQA